MPNDDKLARVNGLDPGEVPDPDRRRIIERPDGIYWEDTATGKIAGPFESVAAALADVDDQLDSSFEPGETLAEAEDEVGMAGWLDQDTGEPAEGSVPRLEDH